jgi:TorA maturation chaperone TorD
MTENEKLSGIYRFLALSMRYPEHDWLNSDYLASLVNITESLEWLEDTEKLKELNVQDAQAFEDLQVEHTRLFITAAGGVYAPPYGSVYLSESGLLFNDATEEVAEYYRQKGFELAREGEAADHIVNELEFLALLTAQDMLDDEKEFLDKYFLPWFGQFRDKVIESAELPFYVIIVKLINFFTVP